MGWHPARVTVPDAPHRDELVPIGGTWSGLLYENLQTGCDLRLTWTFTFDYEPVRREYGTTEPSLSIDWVPFGESNWRSLAGNEMNTKRFAEPIESSVYFFEHYRYDATDIRVVEQEAADVRVSASVRGDIDGLGLGSLYVDQRLRFRGIYVQPSLLPDSTEAAEALLSRFTDTAGLVGVRRQHSYAFEPSGSSRPEVPIN